MLSTSVPFTIETIDLVDLAMPYSSIRKLRDRACTPKCFFEEDFFQWAFRHAGVSVSRVRS